MKVRDIMTKQVVSCQRNADLATAARLMLQGGFGTVPVIDAHGSVAGVLTDRDIALAAGTRQRNAAHISVHEAMTSTVRTCFVGDEVSAALKQMEEAHVRRLPVLDDSLHLAGILSIDDIAARAIDRTDGISAAEFARACGRIASPAIYGAGNERAGHGGEQMSAEHASPSGDAPLAQLERLFIEEFVRSLGHDPARLNELPSSEREALLAEASSYACGRLAEVESRSQLLQKIHDNVTT